VEPLGASAAGVALLCILRGLGIMACWVLERDWLSEDWACINPVATCGCAVAIPGGTGAQVARWADIGMALGRNHSGPCWYSVAQG
jgi:hypothetical protein